MCESMEALANEVEKAKVMQLCNEDYIVNLKSPFCKVGFEIT